MRHVVRFAEIASQLWRNAEHGKKIVCHARGADALRFDIAGRAGQIGIAPADQSKINETALTRAPIQIIRQTHRTGIEDTCALTNEDKAV